MRETVLQQIKKNKLIAIIRGISCAEILDLAEALHQGGVTCMEVTFDQSGSDFRNTLSSIEQIRTQFDGKLCVGAGTAMSAVQVELAAKAGAQYIISPNTDEAVIEKTRILDLVSIPGAMTATEVAEAYRYGADLVKVFPAGLLGPDYIKALRGPLGHIPLTAVGGIGPENCGAFIRAGASAVGCGGKLVSPDLVRKKQFGTIRDIAEKYMEVLAGI
ncbi:bifunctional 4-hydroxy-2-oxoglutarate aldolase/2-dehydro-3-deoxy-phosphogluconate aldolase [Anaerovorax odorimutans]|uniref:Bifunctional 4-hydroxy-2-oxoglutarate aldolase/2-dehydro-3-deoxy-phosphogluconate aldolase n=1 Tax=Anaerovorax odorimutans TaxID=109327 RepID=A0ABT1RQF3_9FIRM|nr:bifunctional 4-hydroxy-2-oxoglutarate aldolase/2-dehydro-3-deoxy-phosphogluconate aldolase [Anaerovorax odorimutans]MCQ4637425.1 bifunctional 4-hydroxy-2-oxoglutarate aldolase/2-dehydro-3-deoxy-phosphogluconate aldolase [Anaerovorax odorimutans]